MSEKKSQLSMAFWKRYSYGCLTTESRHATTKMAMATAAWMSTRPRTHPMAGSVAISLRLMFLENSASSSGVTGLSVTMAGSV